MKKISIDLIGTYPPPIGGTSIHIQRLLRENRKQGIECVEYDTRANEEGKNLKNKFVVPIYNYKKFMFKYLFNKRAQIIHSHSHSWIERMILTIKAKLCKQKVVFTFHSFRDDINKLNWKQKIAYKYVLKNSDKFIATSLDIKRKLIEWGCNEEKINVISPFIVPNEIDKIEDTSDIKKFTSKFDYIVTANASNNNHYNGSDLYGMDMCIELIKYIKKYYNVGFIYVLTKTTDKQYLNMLKKRIKEYDIQNQFMLIEGSVDFISLLKMTTIFIRPTNTDSWPMSISESLVIGVPCIASNVCEREKGTILFQNRNQGELNLKVKECIENIDFEKEKVQKLQIKDHYNEIYETYVKLINKEV